ncbi:MAG: hypothetical protein ACRDHW_22910, partial [Ktedonobacteraceae bacterium]
MDSWIELYNPLSQALDLYASRAEISVDGGTNWYQLPFGSAMAPGTFLVVFLLKYYPTQPPPAWNVVLMLASTNTMIDQVNIPIILSDQSYARVPDGSANWQTVGAPTIAASNNASGQPVTATSTKAPHPTKTPGPTRSTGPASDPGAATPSI